MSNLKVTVVVALLVALLVGGGGYYLYRSNAKPDYLSAWNLTPERIARDLEGKSAPLPFNQVWPFDGTQNLTVSVVSKKQVDEFIIVAVELRATAKVEQPKDAPKDANTKKLPSSVNLSGIAKLTYENIGGDWYLISVDSISLKAVPVD